MFRNIIQGQSTQEIYKIGAEDMKRGSVVVKNLTTKVAEAADDVATEVYLLDFDFQPTGHLADVDISNYSDEADTVKAGTYGILKKLVSGIWGTTQIVEAGLTEGDYLIAGTGATAGKFIKATTGDVTPYKYMGTYDDAGNELHLFEIVEVKTIA